MVTYDSVCKIKFTAIGQCMFVHLFLKKIISEGNVYFFLIRKHYYLILNLITLVDF